jgi:hypothetical protein
MAGAAPTGPLAVLATGSGPGTPGSGRSSWPFPGCAPGRLPQLLGAPAAQRAGAGCSRPGGLRQWRVDPQGGPAGGGAGVGRGSKDTVSRLCGGLDEQVQAFRERPLESAYSYLWLDAKVEKVAGWWAGGAPRPGGRLRCRPAGQREVIGLDVGAAETKAFWREFLRSLVRRGLAGVQLVVSDAHEGLKQAIAQVLGTRGSAARCTGPVGE